MTLEYFVVDVFTRTPLEGNSLAVFPDATGLDDRTMQRIARELSLSETTFLFPAGAPEAVTSVRIFTPARELPFAGHPTLGTAWILRHLGRVPHGAQRFVLEERAGLIPVRIDAADDELLWLTSPAIFRGHAFERGACAAMLGLSEDDLSPAASPRIYGCANANLFVPLESEAAVDRAALDASAFARLVAAEPDPPTCAFVFAATPAGAYSRMFAPPLGILEDPASGSVTGPLALFMMDCELAPRSSGTRFVSEQGTKMGRRSLLHVLISGEYGSTSIEIGGHVTPIIAATMTLGEA